jgi:hypothetical protein
LLTYVLNVGETCFVPSGLDLWCTLWLHCSCSSDLWGFLLILANINCQNRIYVLVYIPFRINYISIALPIVICGRTFALLRAQMVGVVYPFGKTISLYNFLQLLRLKLCFCVVSLEKRTHTSRFQATSDETYKNTTFTQANES